MPTSHIMRRLFSLSSLMLPRLLGAMLLLLAASGCSRDESLPPVRSSLGVGTDGTSHVSMSGTPDEIRELPLRDSLRTGHPTTAPVALPGGGFIVGTANGMLIAVTAGDTVQRIIETGHGAAVSQLLLRDRALCALFADGLLSVMTLQGERRWIDTLRHAPTAALLVWHDAVIVPTEHGATAYALSDGHAQWELHTAGEVTSLVADDGGLFASVTAGQFGTSDTILRVDAKGTVTAHLPLHGRITSNLTLLGEDHHTLACGIVEGTGAAKRPVLAVLPIDQSGGRTVRRHEVPYFINAVGASSDRIITSGFRDLGGELISGVDAFDLKDTAHLWSRRFTEPMLTPVAVGDGSLYFTLTFASDAIVASRGLFYTLSASTGKTLQEQALSGAVDGFVPGMPMPDEAGRLMLADRGRAVIHLIDRSVYHRLF